MLRLFILPAQFFRRRYKSVQADGLPRGRALALEGIGRKVMRLFRETAMAIPRLETAALLGLAVAVALAHITVA